MDKSRREFVKKLAWVAPTITIISMPETVTAVASGWDKGNNGWGNGDQYPPGYSGPHNNAENGQ